MKRIIQFITKILKILKIPSRGSARIQSGIMGRGQIINPKYTPPSQIIEPIQYEFTDKQLRTVLRRYNYINVKPPRQYVPEEA